MMTCISVGGGAARQIAGRLSEMTALGFGRSKGSSAGFIGRSSPEARGAVRYCES